jgi:hypothetical protein
VPDVFLRHRERGVIGTPLGAKVGRENLKFKADVRKPRAGGHLSPG